MQPGAVESVAKETVEVGRVFGGGGTDGLILYALILAVFLMFLALCAFAMLLRRSLQSLDTQSKSFATAGEKTADSLKELASAIASNSAQDQSHQMMVAQTLGRLEAVLPRPTGGERNDIAP